MSLTKRIGRYEVVGELAQGGMAEILLGRLTGPSGFERVVVVKRILKRYATSPSFVSMFLDEARIAASIRHPNVVQVFELGQEGDDLFLVMDYLEGESLASLLRRLVARGETLPIACAGYLAEQALAGLHAAHELRGADGSLQGVVHRDVSPDNVFIGYDGTVRLLDFGIAKAADRITRTEAGELKGKFAYMSPEQCAGRPLDRRSDLFSLAVVLFEALTLRKLFRRPSTLATMRAVLDDPIPRVRDFRAECPAEVDAVVARALERNLASRHANALELRAALREALQRTTPDASPDQSLAAMMQALFADRIAEKSDMLSRLRDGSSISVVPVPEVDLEVELPSVALLETRRERPRRSWVWPSAIGAAVVVAISIAGIVFASSSPAESARAPAEEPPPTAPAPEETARGSKVRIAVDSRPRGAAVIFAGVERGLTPIDFEVERGAAQASVRIELDGYLASEEQFVPSVDQRLYTVLERQLEQRSERRRDRRARPVAQAEMRAAAPAETAEMRAPEFRLLP
jgi:eukaryotic-like serine/threonine-protein kinase